MDNVIPWPRPHSKEPGLTAAANQIVVVDTTTLGNVMIEDFAKLVPTALQDKSGKVFYSGRLAFEKPSEVYLLGVNPGGSPEELQSETVASHSEKVLHELPSDWSAYRDESWRGKPPGFRGMQPRVLHLLQRLELSPGQVPASNLVFVRSRREQQLGGDFKELATQCWPFHQYVIDTLQIRVVVCFGQSAGNWVCNELGAHTQVSEYTEDNNRRWQSRVFRNKERISVAILTHPSIANWVAPATDPTELVRTGLERV